MTDIPNKDFISSSDTYPLPRQIFRKFVHWASYNFILSSKRTRKATIGDLHLSVPPTVFHPGIFLTSRMFANYLRCLDLRGTTVAEVGTGSGVLALSAACSGARKVVALDINPAAVAAATTNAQANGLSAVVEARVSDLLSAVEPEARFDVIICSPPSFAGEPRDVADRAWHAGPGYRDLRPLLTQAWQHLADNGEVLLLLSSDTNVALIRRWATEAGFSWRLLAEKSIGIESFLIFRLCRGTPVGTRQTCLPDRAELRAAYLRRRTRDRIGKMEALAASRARFEACPEAAVDVLAAIDREMKLLAPEIICETYLSQARERSCASSGDDDQLQAEISQLQ